MVYSYHARIASHWRKGNIFLLGDAAHCQPAITGGGLCNGMRDALNLCWKLAYVIKGKASASLLEVSQSARSITLGWRDTALGKLRVVTIRVWRGATENGP